ncbi:hypothetical protein HOP50_04g29000 [Chloropicon primus]|uniref:Uncharacterized protein n=1 Tax=Chloropicon primus TaxID=1764295 RepID=A0A5B8MIU8_9CHLO|nr:hypothetical protein A3770_04p29010 [Chloropicon primus]UPQ99592.1 hypothetical protein HOP50_04g29000 [Chloropicon primus]|eukprot:QDZ20383.1 hypothetical protein A3770_04p29010 [Chloropicon primus]
MKKSYDDGKVLIRWDEDVKTERTNFWKLFKLQARLSGISVCFGFCIMLLVGLATSNLLRTTCSYVVDRKYDDYTDLKEEFFSCALNHWSSLLLYRPLTMLWLLLTTFTVWNTFIYKTKKDKVFAVVFAVLAFFISTFTYFTDGKAVAFHQIGDPKYNSVNNETYATSMMLFPYMSIITVTVLYLLITRATRKGAGVIVFVCLMIEIAGYYVYSAALENLLIKGTPVWQIVLFRYVFHEIFWGIVLWGYRVIIRNSMGLDAGAEALLMCKVVTVKAIYAKFLLVQLKGFGQIIAINFFDALMNFFMRSLYVIYDEWFMNMQYGNRAAKAIISTQEENYLRTFEAQAETFASAPAVFITGGLLLFGHFQPVAGEAVNHTKVIIDIAVQLVTNFASDWLSMVAEDKFFAAQHSKVFKKRMPYWTMKMFFMQLLGLALFMLGSGYSPFCPHKYDHGIMLEYCG